MDPFTLPDNLTELSVEELEALGAQVLEHASALPAPDDPAITDEQVAQYETLANARQTLNAELSARAETAAERTTRAAAAAALLTASQEDGDAGDGEGDDAAALGAGGEADAGDGDEGAETGTEGSADTGTTEGGAQGASGAQTGQGVQAGGSRAPARRTGSVVRTAQKRPVRRPKTTSGLRLSAQPDVSGFAAGAALEGIEDLAKAFIARSRGFGPGGGRELRQQFGVALIGKDFDGMTTSNPDYREDYELVMAASKESRLPGGSLLAAGGWCAPSETLYDLCENESLDGLVDIPEIGVSRGGIRFTTGPDFGAIYEDAGFCQTEAEAIAGTPKPCVDIECPPFEEVRLDACGICVRAPILTNAAYPELVQRWIRGTLVAHQHKMSAKVINAMAAALGAAPQVVPGTAVSVHHQTLTALELAAEGLRYRYRMSFNETLEVVAPKWLRAAIRADLAFRNGRDSETVSDEEIQSHFANRGVRVQWVYDWQPLLYPDLDPGAPVVPGCAIDYPDTVELLVYPAGSFVKGTSDVISLDAVYDTAGLQQNMYTAVFAEEGILVAQTCFSGCRLTVPVCISGRTGAADSTACYGSDDTP